MKIMSKKACHSSSIPFTEAMLSDGTLPNELLHAKGLVGRVGGVPKGLKSEPEVVRSGEGGI